MVAKSVKTVEKVNVDNKEELLPLEEEQTKFNSVLTEEEIEERKRQLDEKFLSSSLLQEMRNHYMKQRRLKKFRNPMTHLTPKKKKRKK